MYNKRISISPKVDAELKKLSTKISKNFKKFKKLTKVGEILFENDIGDSGFVEIYAKSDYEFEAKIDGDSLDSLFIIVGSDPNPLTVYNSLYHEMLHATDPEFFDDEVWEDYDPNVDESYYGHRLEFRTLTNEFLNALYNVYKDKLRGGNSSTKKRLHDSLTNIVNYYLHDEPLSDFASDLLDYAAGSTKYSENKLRDFYSKVQLKYPGEYNLTISTFNREKLPIFIRGYLNKVREYNPTQWSDFMSMLLSTREEIMELF